MLVWIWYLCDIVLEPFPFFKCSREEYFSYITATSSNYMVTSTTDRLNQKPRKQRVPDWLTDWLPLSRVSDPKHFHAG